MYKMPKLAIITILILLIGLNFCVVYLIWIVSQRNQILTIDQDQYIIIFFIISIFSFVSGILFLAGQKSWTMENLCSRIENSRTINNCILLLDQRKKEIDDGIPDFVEVKIVTPSKNKL